ncbi:MAG TPA: radical SAM protein [Planctomycetota bacterium]|nr:radical SAM protein [Planctomycetota bacterium]
MAEPLTTRDHDRRRGNRTYVYPVVSRRARGVSVGVNLNPNNACNWRCVYCQVPGLVFGNAPEIDLAQLERELSEQLVECRSAQWLEQNAPLGARRLNDVAFSGNGEPTSSRQLPEVVALAGRTLSSLALLHTVKLVLITNGSLLHLEHVERSVRSMAELSGEVWFKLDSATDAGIVAINNFAGGSARQLKNLERCARLCPTWIQTCLLAFDGREPSREERSAYLQAIEDLVRAHVPVRGVQLYSIARESHQPEAPRLCALDAEWLATFAREIEARGLPVQIAP